MRNFILVFVCGLVASLNAQTDWKALEEGAKDKDSSIRLSVVKALSGSSDFRAIPLLDSLVWDEDRKVADASLTALNKVLRARSDEESQLRSGKNREEQLEIWQRYEVDRPYWRYVRCEKYLGDVRDAVYSRDEKAIASLLKVLADKTYSNDDPPKVDEIMWGCGTGVDYASIEAMELLVERCPDVVRKMIRDPKTSIRSTLLGHLSKLRDRQDVPLVKMLFASPNITLRAQAVSVVHEMFFPELFPLVLKATADKSVIVRYTSVRPLKRFVNDESIDAVCRLLQDSDQEVAIEAIEALDEFDSPKFDKVILHLIRSSDPNLRRRGLAAFTYHPVERALPELLRALKLKTEERALAISALATLKESAAIEQVLSIALDQRDPNRRNAVWELPNLGDAGVQTLLSLLGDHREDADTLETLISIVRDKKLKSAIPALHRLRSHASQDVRQKATDALRQLGVAVVDP